jgi:signal transduction histidine kinase
MANNVERIRSLIGDTLNYVSMDESAFTWLNLNVVIEDAAGVFNESMLRQGIQFQFQPVSHPPLIRGNAVQIREVVINLIQNGLEAMNNEGRLQISTDLQEELEGGISRKYLLMVVSDTGPGMSANVMEKIFTPFFTTKSGGKGLGLAFAKRILEEQGGFMRCWSKEGIGTHFYVYFKIGEKHAVYLDR